MFLYDLPRMQTDARKASVLIGGVQTLVCYISINTPVAHVSFSLFRVLCFFLRPTFILCGNWILITMS